MSSSCNNKLRIGNNSEVLSLINDLLKVDSYRAALYIGEIFRVVDKDGNTFGTNFLCSISEHKKHGVNDITFTTTIWSDDGGKAFVEGTEDLFTGIALKIRIFNVSDNQTRTI